MADFVDINYFGKSKDDNIISDPLALFIQEVFLAIQTGPGQIWGISESIDISRYVFNKYVTITQISNEIQTYITRHCEHSKNFSWTINVEFIKNEGKDLLYITMTVLVPDRTGNQNKYVQKFLLGN